MEDNKSKGVDPQVIFLELKNYVAPDVVEVAGSKWVNYGADNMYFQYILDRYRGSPTNHAIINAIADQIVGEGLTSEYASHRPDAYAKARILFPYENMHRFAFDLKCYGWYMEVIVMKDDHSEIESVDYSPVQNWRASKCNSEGIVESYWYSDNWAEYRKKEFKPREYKVYDPDEKEQLTMCLPVMPYRSGSFYYPTVDYQGCLQYAHIEEEISNFHLNNIMNGLAPGMLINFNNGDPGQEQRQLMESKINKKWSGSSNSGKMVLAFNDNKESAATIESVDINDLDKQYQFLSEESTSKILVGHRVTSPLFFGVRDSGGGLGSNADEIKNSWLLWERTVLRPYRKIMLDNVNFILNQLGETIPLTFDELTPIDFEEPEADHGEKIEQSKDDFYRFQNKGETVDPKLWELVGETEVDYTIEDFLDKMLVNLATTVKSSGIAGESEQDNPLFLTRYVYAPQTTSGDSRDFCKKMVASKLVYKKEDIIKAENMKVNAGWGLGGADTYSIWDYKGGGNCHHYWMRQTYLAKGQEKVSSSQVRKMLNAIDPDDRDKYRPPKETNRNVAKRPVDMPNNGFVNK